MKSTNKELVLEWIRAGCNYANGVAIYESIGRNQSLKLLFPGKQHRYSGKLFYELCKSAGIDRNSITDLPSIPETYPRPGLLSNPASNPVIQPGEVEESELKPKRSIAEYPAIIRRVITEYAELFQERSKTHTIMTEMPPGNSMALKAKRAELFNIIKALSDRLEYLYGVQQQFEKNMEVPSAEIIWPKPKKQEAPELPGDVESLKKMKKNLQSANTKDQNMLDFQSEKKGNAKKPMPAGPKRMKIENRIKARLKMVEEINYKLLIIEEQ